MTDSLRKALAGLTVIILLTACAATAAGQDSVPAPGQRVPLERCGPVTSVTMSEVAALDAALGERDLSRLWNSRAGVHGKWVVPRPWTTEHPHSGRHYVINKWGDTLMGIGFPEVVDVFGATFAGQSDHSVWTVGIRVIGYRAGEVVQETGWFRSISENPTWFAMNLQGVDRIVIQSEPSAAGIGMYAMDDLTFAPHSKTGGPVPARDIVVVDFEEAGYGKTLNGSHYAGLTWEEGHGEVGPAGGRAMPPPQEGPTPEAETAPPPTRNEEPNERERDGTTPTLRRDFRGYGFGGAYPPDTMGAVGPDHFVEVVNQHFVVYDKSDGEILQSVSLDTFLGGPEFIGDPRVLFDVESQRWVVIATSFNDESALGRRIFLAVSSTSNPRGSWVRSSWLANSYGWPDFPTLGVDVDGIYVGAYIIGTGSMKLYAIDKGQFVQGNLVLYEWGGLDFEGALQPAHTYGDPGGEYVLSRYSTTSIRVRRITWAGGVPNLTQTSFVPISYHDNDSPPDAPALGSLVNIDSGSHRLQMAIYRNGSLWTCQTIRESNRAACRWYEISATAMSVIQYGTIYSSGMYYYYPSVTVNEYGDAVMGFSGSNSNQYPACYYVGRLATDPPGQMSAPVLYKAGEGAYTLVDPYGRNRWGDYSYTSADPANNTFWTIQEYSLYSTGNDGRWGTWVANLTFDTFPDCNDNGVDDQEDIASGFSQDCNGNGVPDECDLADGASEDCNNNGIPDECDLVDGDCNENGIPDECDIWSGSSFDCQFNLIPDECELEGNDCNGNSVPDDCDVMYGLSPDENGNGIPDECEQQDMPGDLNCDQLVNFDDIDAFVLALTGQAAYEAQWPDCRWLNADCNNDGNVNFDDIDPFVSLLAGAR